MACTSCTMNISFKHIHYPIDQQYTRLGQETGLTAVPSSASTASMLQKTKQHSKHISTYIFPSHVEDMSYAFSSVCRWGRVTLGTWVTEVWWIYHVLQNSPLLKRIDLAVMQYIQPILKGFLLVDAATKSKIKDRRHFVSSFLALPLWHTSTVTHRSRALPFQTTSVA